MPVSNEDFIPENFNILGVQHGTYHNLSLLIYFKQYEIGHWNIYICSITCSNRVECVEKTVFCSAPGSINELWLFDIESSTNSKTEGKFLFVLILKAHYCYYKNPILEPLLTTLCSHNLTAHFNINLLSFLLQMVSLSLILHWKL